MTDTTPEQAVIQAVTPEMFNAYAEWESPDLPEFPVKHAAFLGWVRTAFMAGFRSARLAQSQPASEGLREALNWIDGEAPPEEPRDGPTVGFPPPIDPREGDLNEVVQEAFEEGVRRGLWLAAEKVRTGLNARPGNEVTKARAIYEQAKSLLAAAYEAAGYPTWAEMVRHDAGRVAVSWEIPIALEAIRAALQPLTEPQRLGQEGDLDTRMARAAGNIPTPAQAEPVALDKGAVVEAVKRVIPDVHILISDGFYDKAADKIATAVVRAQALADLAEGDAE